MTEKTLEDCARCSDLTKCEAHITGGTIKQCAPIIDAEKTNDDLHAKVGKPIQTFRHGSMTIEEVSL